jgi:hypothetical protein
LPDTPRPRRDLRGRVHEGGSIGLDAVLLLLGREIRKPARGLNNRTTHNARFQISFHEAAPTGPLVGVFCGHRLIGFVLRRGGDGCEALDPSGHSLGVLVDEIAAVSALLTRRLSA